ncbi:twin-arginine translocation signal domain-containing protein [Streptomyces sp. NPDC048002]|uniref:twin-arginine translocation signal domain-containing protein n=1 Tax=unclassified Streptomyces TaxID=2593676 RepID=UPI0033F4790C
MSSLSRRSLLGYSGTTAAGAVLGTAASAQPAQAAETAEAAQAADAAPAAEAGAPAATQFAHDTFFTGRTWTNTGGETNAEVQIEFRVTNSETPAALRISPLELAELLSEFAQSRGWPAITFYGDPAPVALN